MVDKGHVYKKPWRWQHLLLISQCWFTRLRINLRKHKSLLSPLSSLQILFRMLTCLCLILKMFFGRNVLCFPVSLNIKESFGSSERGCWTTERDVTCLVEATGDPWDHFKTRVTPFPSSSSHICCRECGLKNSLHSPVLSWDIFLSPQMWKDILCRVLKSLHENKSNQFRFRDNNLLFI